MTKSKLRLSVILILFIISVLLVPLTFGKYTSTYTRTITLNISKPTYTVVFHSNTEPDQTTTQSFTYGTAQNLNANTFTNGNRIFLSWNTAANGSGTSYQNGVQVNNLTSVNNGTVDLYAQWASNVCEVNNVEYLTINECLSHISANNQQTELKMIADVILGSADRIHIDNGKNVLLNLNGHTISNKNGANIPIIEAVGTVTVRNGTIRSTAGQAIINLDESTGKAYVDNVTLIATGGKQVIYNNAGYLEIGSGAIITRNGPNVSINNRRAAVQTQANGTTVILGGTITNNNYYGVLNAGSLRIGDNDGTVDHSYPFIQGEYYGVSSTPTYDFFDGIIEGTDAAVNDELLIDDIATGTDILHATDGNYHKISLGVKIIITFDANGGTVSEPSREIYSGGPIGQLPTPQYTGYDFLGWFTDPVNGTEVLDTTTFSSSDTIYAHWQVTTNYVASMNGTDYETLQAAINAVRNNNTKHVITILKDIDNENLTVSANKYIEFDIGSHTISNTAGILIENKGKIEITNGKLIRNGSNDQKRVIENKSSGTVIISGGEIKSNAHQAIRNYGNVSITGGKIWLGSDVDQGVINNESTGTITISGGEIIGTKRQAVYNAGGNMTITGTAVLSNGYGATANRACVQNNTGTATISGGTITSPSGAYPAVLNQATMSITGGTIRSTGYYGVSNESTLTIGDKDYSVNQSNPSITGRTYGVYNTSTFNFYDGIIKGITNSVYGAIADYEYNAVEVNSTEVIDGDTYQTKTQTIP